MAARASASGALRLTVLPDNLLIQGASAARPDRSTREVAALLHSHGIAEMVLHGGTDAESWRAFLLLLSRHPDEIRADGGIEQLWARAGAPSIEIRELDYTQITRERAITDIFLSALRSESFTLSDESLVALVEIASDPARLRELNTGVQKGMAEDGAAVRGNAFLRLIRSAAEHAMRDRPRELEAIFGNLAREAGTLSLEVLTAVLDQRGKAAAIVGETDVVDAITGRMDESTLASFVAQAVIDDDGASARLAEAFRTLVPDAQAQSARSYRASTRASSRRRRPAPRPTSSSSRRTRRSASPPGSRPSTTPRCAASISRSCSTSSRSSPIRSSGATCWRLSCRRSRIWRSSATSRGPPVSPKRSPARPIRPSGRSAGRSRSRRCRRSPPPRSCARRSRTCASATTRGSRPRDGCVTRSDPP
jgi:hypothetical protein